MSALSVFLHKILPNPFKESINFGLHQRNYSQFRLLLFLVMIAIAMGPVIMTAGLGYYNYKDLLQKEERGQLESRLTGSSHAIEALIDNLKSVVLFVARKNRYVELTTGNNLEELFVRIKRQYEYFADLGVINQSGIQQTYWGPYDLQGTDYSKELWFKEVIDKGVYISHVYNGYRHVPHFAIAVANHDPTTRKTGSCGQPLMRSLCKILSIPLRPMPRMISFWLTMPDICKPHRNLTAKISHNW